MKSIKLILPVVAFALAIVTAFASDAFLQNPAKGKRPSDSQCVGGDLIPVAGKQCLTTNNLNRCQVTVVDQGEEVIVPAFANGGTCQVGMELFSDIQP